MMEPLLRPRTAQKGSVGLAHPQVVTSHGEEALARLATSQQGTGQAALLPLMFGMHTEADSASHSLSPYIVQAVTSLRWHFHDLFVARFVGPLVRASGVPPLDPAESSFAEDKASAKKTPLFAIRDPSSPIKTLPDIAKLGDASGSNVAFPP